MPFKFNPLTGKLDYYETGGDSITPAALTRVDDTNVTLTLGGTPSTALLQAVSLTLGWTGELSLARGGTGASLADPGADRILFWDDSAGAVTWLTVGTGLQIVDTTLSSTITQYTDEMARDALGAALVAGNNIDITVDDGADTITIAVESLTSADITDFSEAVDDRVSALLVAGNNIDLTYDDGANTLTIDVESLTSADITDFAEAVDDRVAVLLVAGNNIDITYNDAGGTLTIDVESLTSADITDFTEAVQDVVGAFATDGNGIDFTYSDVGNTLTADIFFTSQTPGDLIRRNTAGTAWERLPTSTDGFVLTVVSGMPAWAAPAVPDVAVPQRVMCEIVTFGDEGTEPTSGKHYPSGSPATPTDVHIPYVELAASDQIVFKAVMPDHYTAGTPIFLRITYSGTVSSGSMSATGDGTSAVLDVSANNAVSANMAHHNNDATVTLTVSAANTNKIFDNSSFEVTNSSGVMDDGSDTDVTVAPGDVICVTFKRTDADTEGLRIYTGELIW